MLFVLFHLGTDGYLIEAAGVDVVLPLVDLKHVPQAPAGVAGVLNRGGSAIPVIDLSLLATGRSAVARMNTRILLVRFDAVRGPARPLGLLVERVLGTVRRDAAEFVPAGVAAEPWLGPVVPDNGRLLQRLDLQKLLPASLQDRLFADDGANP